jgi:hypothetical protein
MVAALSAALIVSPSPAGAAEPSADDLRAMQGSPGIMEACPTDQNVRWSRILTFYVGHRYTVISSTPTFYASDGTAVDNFLSDPVTATFTSSVSRTTTITVTAGSSVQLLEVLQFNVSVSIVNSRTTAIGVNVTATVPPLTRVTGLYGVDGYDVVYDTQLILRQGTNCQYGEVRRGSTAAPTFIEGWRFTATPL